MNVDFDLILVVLFLLVTLNVGFRYGSKVKTMNDYALGGRNFSTMALVATLVATWFGSGSLSWQFSRTYSDGLAFMIPSYGMAVSFFIVAYIFIPKMSDFLGKLSVAEAMGDFYGKYVRIIVAFTGIASSVGIIGIQFKVFGGFVSYFLGINPIVGIIVASSIVTIYSSFGGIKAVTFTDVLQMVTFTFVIPIIGVIIWNQIYHDSISFSHIFENEKFDIYAMFRSDPISILSLLALFILFATPGFEPFIFQRISMAKDVDQAKKAFLIAGFILVLVILSIQWIPILLFQINPALDKAKLLNYIIENYSYLGFKALIISGVIAMAMSTADSAINACSVLFAHDIYGPLGFTRYREIHVSKVFSLALGFIGIIFAVYADDLLQMVLTTASFYMPIATVPLMLTILGFRTTAVPVLISMFAGGATVAIWNYKGIEADPIVFAMIVNGIFLLGSHHLLKCPGGWVENSSARENLDVDFDLEENQQEPIPEFNFGFYEAINPSNWLEYCKEKFPTNEISYVSLGIYCIIYTVTTMYATQSYLASNMNGEYVWILYQIMMVTGTILIAYPVWPFRDKNGLREVMGQVMWPVVIFSMLIVGSGFFIMVSRFNLMQFAVFTMNLQIASLLLGWRLSIVMYLIGFMMSFYFHELYDPGYAFSVDIGSPAFITIYLFLLISSSIILFFKPKQEELEEERKSINFLKREKKSVAKGFDDITNSFQELESKLSEKEMMLKATEVYMKDQLKWRNIEISKLKGMKDEFLRNLSHESTTPLMGVVSLCDVLYSCYDNLDTPKIKNTMKHIIRSGERLKSYIFSMLDLSKLKSFKYDLKKERVNLTEMVRERPLIFKKVFPDDAYKQEFKYDVDEDVILPCDPYFMVQMMDHLIKNASDYGNNKPIELRLKKIESGVFFEIIDQGIGVPADEIHSIFEEFSLGSRTSNKSGGRGIGLALCKKVIESHGGNIVAKSDGKTGTKLQFVLPDY